VTDQMSKADLRAPDYFGHMLQACDRILQYTSDMTRDRFLADSMVQDAVMRNIEILGEATRNLMECLPDLQATYPHIPWIDIYGMRNRITHGYVFINLELVWTVAEVNVPELRQQLQKALDEM